MKDGLFVNCKQCSHEHYYKPKMDQYKIYARRSYLKNTLGITLEDAEALIASGICEACGTKVDRMHIDHDHTTSKIRGALCHGCNVALGYVKEDPERLRALANYIEKHK